MIVIRVLVIPAEVGLRRQDAEANAEGGPKGRPQERPVIHLHFRRCDYTAKSKWVPGFRRDDGILQIP